MRMVDAKDLHRWIAFGKQSKARARRRRRAAMWVAMCLVLALWVNYTRHHAYPLLVRHLGVPGGRVVPDLKPILAGNAHRPVWEAAALRLCDLGPRGTSALPVIERRLADRFDQWLLVYAATRMGDEALGVLAVASMGDNIQIAQLARPYFDEYPLDRKVVAMLQVAELVAQRDERSPYYENAVKWLGAVGPNAHAKPPEGRSYWDIPSAAPQSVDKELAGAIAQVLVRSPAMHLWPLETLPIALFRMGEAAAGPIGHLLRKELELAEDGHLPRSFAGSRQALFWRRMQCYRILRELGPKARTATPFLIEAVEKEINGGTPNCAKDALDALLAIGPEGPDRTRALEMLRRVRTEDSPEEFNRAFRELAGPEEVPLLLAELEACTKGSTVLLETLQAFGRIGPPAQAALPALREGMAHSSAILRVEAARAFWQVGGAPEEALAVLREVISEARSGGDRAHAARAFHQMGGSTDIALSMLRKVMASDHFGAPFAAVTLHELGGTTEEALPVLIDVLERRSNVYYHWVFRAVDVMDADARPMIPAMSEVLLDQKARLEHRIAFAEALAEIDPESAEVTAALTEAADNDPSHCVRCRAIKLLESRPDAFLPLASIDEALRALERSKPDSAERRRAIETLRQRGGEVAIPLAEWLLAHRSALSSPAGHARSVLAELGPAARPAVPVFAAAAADPSRKESEAAVRALEALGPVARDAIPALLPDMAASWDRQNALKAIDPAAYVAWRHDPTPARIILGGALALAGLLAVVIRRSRAAGTAGASGSAGTDAPYDDPLEHSTLASSAGRSDGQV